MFDFDDLIDILDGEEFEEKPVDLRTFVNDPNYLGLPPLSDYQYTLIEKSSQIYKESTLKKLFHGRKLFPPINTLTVSFFPGICLLTSSER